MVAILHLRLGSVSINRQGAHTRNSASPLDQSVLIGEEGDRATCGEDGLGSAMHAINPLPGSVEANGGKKKKRLPQINCQQQVLFSRLIRQCGDLSLNVFLWFSRDFTDICQVFKCYRHFPNS